MRDFTGRSDPAWFHVLNHSSAWDGTPCSDCGPQPLPLLLPFLRRGHAGCWRDAWWGYRCSIGNWPQYLDWADIESRVNYWDLYPREDLRVTMANHPHYMACFPYCKTIPAPIARH